jgi:hypothetical protein
MSQRKLSPEIQELFLAAKLFLAAETGNHPTISATVGLVQAEMLGSIHSILTNLGAQLEDVLSAKTPLPVTDYDETTRTEALVKEIEDHPPAIRG